MLIAESVHDKGAVIKHLFRRKAVSAGKHGTGFLHHLPNRSIDLGIIKRLLDGAISFSPAESPCHGIRAV